MERGMWRGGVEPQILSAITSALPMSELEYKRLRNVFVSPAK